MSAPKWQSFCKEHWRPFVVVAALLTGLQFVELAGYDFFHVLVEIFSIVVACTIFAVYWNARRFLDNTFFLLIGVSSLFIAFLDLFHALSIGSVQLFPRIWRQSGDSVLGIGTLGAVGVVTRGTALDA